MKTKNDAVVERLRLFGQMDHDPKMFLAIRQMSGALKRGGKILVFGNGGSATQSSHFAVELVNKFRFRRQALAAVSLASDMASITAIANDEGFAQVFSRQIEALGKPKDIALGLTTSGKSANVREALKVARRMGLGTIALCGRHTADLKKIKPDVVVAVDSSDTPLIQEVHLAILHTIAEHLEKDFFGGDHG